MMDRRNFVSAGLGAITAAAAPGALAMTNPSAAWDAAMARWSAAETDCDRHPDFEDVPHEVMDREIRALADLMDTPAPDRAELRWKLGKLLADDGSGATADWDIKYVRGAMSDIAHLLGDA